MLVHFKSKAAAEVMMFEEHAKMLLGMFRKDVQRGVFTAAECQDAIARLEAMIAQSKQEAAAHADRDVHLHGRAHDEGERDPMGEVSLATHAYPLLEMMRAAHKGGHDILWGV